MRIMKVVLSPCLRSTALGTSSRKRLSAWPGTAEAANLVDALEVRGTGCHQLRGSQPNATQTPTARNSPAATQTTSISTSGEECGGLGAGGGGGNRVSFGACPRGRPVTARRGGPGGGSCVAASTAPAKLLQSG